MTELTFENLSEVLARQYQEVKLVEITECNEPLVEIPPTIPRYAPHAYEAVGAPYGSSSPYVLREGVRDRVMQASEALQKQNLQLKIFDGYRPLSVQAFMVKRTFEEYRMLPRFSSCSEEDLYAEVFKLWATPNLNPKEPPPHSTGGAVDLTIVRADGSELDMGSAIDESGPVQLPNHFKHVNPVVHANRELLRTTMEAAGFVGILHEWWHFSFGDRYWAFREMKRTQVAVNARYGRVDLA